MKNSSIQRIVCISDTHGLHGKVSIPDGDLLLHAGDISNTGLPGQVGEFMAWFAAQPHRHKVMIAGNHDFMAEKDPAGFQALVPSGVIYLNDSGVEIEGIRIWGSPIQPWFHDWAFNRRRGPDIARHWDMIPDGIDILITHGPPFGKCDRLSTGAPIGCEDLMQRVQELRPKLHLFGHIHEAYGMTENAHTMFVNASVLDLQYKHTQQPIVIDWPILPREDQ